MSTIMNCIIKKNNEYIVFDISSGGLRDLYNPKIFDGDDKAINAFIKKAFPDNIQYVKANESLLKKYKYFVVIDFDKKEIIDYQPARHIQFLSNNIDSTWLFIEDWMERNELIPGLVEPETLEIVKPFPSNYDKNFNIFNFLEKNKKPFPVDENGDIIWLPSHTSYYIAIAPKGWVFTMINNNEDEDVAHEKIKEYYN